MQRADQAEGCIPLPSFRSLFGAKERPDPPDRAFHFFGLGLRAGHRAVVRGLVTRARHP